MIHNVTSIEMMLATTPHTKELRTCKIAEELLMCQPAITPLQKPLNVTHPTVNNSNLEKDLFDEISTQLSLQRLLLLRHL